MVSAIDARFSLAGRVALVTGGAKGIGNFIAEGLVQAGVKVYLTSRNAQEASAMAASLGGDGACTGLGADLLQLGNIEALAREIAGREPRLDILINNSGAFWRGPLETFPEQGWDDVMDLNVKAPFFLTKLLTPLLAAAGTPGAPARVVNVSSIAGARAYDNDGYPYQASKAALNHLTRTMAARLARDNITVNAISPGPMAGGMMRRTTQDDAFREEIERRIPLRRVGQPDDLMGAVQYLCSPAGRYLTGVVIPLDGGASTCT
jgi:NAD(P)-dependent dehydrogenase (short-subunit alcohol dehydrogenase family)